MMTIFLMEIRKKVFKRKPLMIVLQSLKRLTAKVKLEAVRFPMAHRLGGSGAPEVRENLLSSCLLIQKKIFILM